MEKNTGKKFVTQGKLRENTGNFILARMWPPCSLVNRGAVDTVFRILSISDQMSCKGHTESIHFLQKICVGELCANPIELTSLYSLCLFVFKEQGIDRLKLSHEEEAPKWHK